MSLSAGTCNSFFLFEIFINKFEIRSVFLDGLNVNSPIATLVKFGKLVRLELCKSNVNIWKWTKSDNDTKTLNFLQGKSCIFTTNPKNLSRLVSNSILKLIFLEKLTNITIGKITIPIGTEILNLIENPSEEQKEESLSDWFSVIGKSELPIGRVQLTIRLTNLGTALFTNIQFRDEENENYRILLKGEDNFVNQPNCKACGPILAGVCCSSDSLNLSQKSHCDDSEVHLPDETEVSDVQLSSVHSVTKDSSVCCKRIPSEGQFQENINQDSQFRRKPKHKTRKISQISNKQKCAETAKLESEVKYCRGPKRSADGLMNERHKKCLETCHLVPANHGWAWLASATDIKEQSVSSSAPSYLTKSKTWFPGFITPEILCKVNESRLKRGLSLLPTSGLDDDPVYKSVTTAAMPVMHVHRSGGHCAISFYPLPKRGKRRKALQLNIKQPYEEGSATPENDVKFEFYMPSKLTTLEETLRARECQTFLPSPPPRAVSDTEKINVVPSKKKLEETKNKAENTNAKKHK